MNPQSMNGSAIARRLQCMYEVTRTFAAFDAVERTLPALLRTIDGTLPLASAILIEARDGRLRKLVWHPETADPGRVLRAEANAWATYTFYAGPVPEHSREVDVQRFPVR